ncbi:MAG: PD-(D/E)XK nuclease family protein, partial [Thermodesulfobacteriota bacterium]
ARGEAPPEVTVEQVAGLPGARPHGKRFGALVHAVLATIPLDADASAVAAAATLHGRVLGAAPDEVEAASGTALRALAHPVLARAAAAAKRGACRRECPVTLELDGVLVEGVVDVAFREDGPAAGWTVVDFKSDLEIAGRLDEYRRQVELYALAVARATGMPARAVLLRV